MALDTGTIVVVPIHGGDQGDTMTLPDTLKAAQANLLVEQLESTYTLFALPLSCAIIWLEFIEATIMSHHSRFF